MSFADTLKDLIVKKELYSPIKNKNFVNVEGWQFAGACLGIRPIVTECYRVTEGIKQGEIRYRARVDLFQGEMIVGTGFASCSNLEYSKRKFDEYAIESMAQTRAVGKAYRSTIGFLLKCAGYEPTPAEEMADVIVEVEPEPVQPKPAPKKAAPKKKFDAHQKVVDDVRTKYAECIAAGCSEDDVKGCILQFTDDITKVPELGQDELIVILAAYDGLLQEAKGE